MQIILFQPQIPQNAGNVVRSCAVTGTSLRMVRPLGFTPTDKHLKRAGLDYWEGVDVGIIEDLESYLEQCSSPFFFFSSKVEQRYTDIQYPSNSILIFGSETAGLPLHYHERWKEKFATIPMRPGVRCLNLATSVGIVLYEALRQNNFSFT
jgi:tRNA (cytidine/uridine-2'-O-)-methyltransferase